MKKDGINKTDGPKKRGKKQLARVRRQRAKKAAKEEKKSPRLLVYSRDLENFFPYHL